MTKARVRLIIMAAVSRNGIIGRNGRLPWHLSKELRLFRYLTMGRTLLMGRKTFESLPSTLPGRRLWVLSTQPPKPTTHAQFFPSIESALEAAVNEKLDVLYVIGGGKVFQQLMPLADEMRISKILAHVEGDVRFPSYALADWHLRFEQYFPADLRSPLPFLHQHWTRIA